jgi:hypothetical protein
VKPAIIWHGTVHAREWIVAPVGTHCAQLLSLHVTNIDPLDCRVYGLPADQGLPEEGCLHH